MVKKQPSPSHSINRESTRTTSYSREYDELVSQTSGLRLVGEASSSREKGQQQGSSTARRDSRSGPGQSRAGSSGQSATDETASSTSLSMATQHASSTRVARTYEASSYITMRSAELSDRGPFHQTRAVRGDGGGRGGQPSHRPLPPNGLGGASSSATTTSAATESSLPPLPEWGQGNTKAARRRRARREEVARLRAHPSATNLTCDEDGGESIYAPSGTTSSRRDGPPHLALEQQQKKEKLEARSHSTAPPSVTSIAATSGSTTATRSVLSREEASQICSDFLSESGTFASSSAVTASLFSERERKLLVWQALLVKFGVCHTTSDEDSDSQDEDFEDHSSSSSSDDSQYPIPPQLYDGQRLPLPTSLKGCERLLKQYVIINIKDFLESENFVRGKGEVKLFSR